MHDLTLETAQREAEDKGAILRSSLDAIVAIEQTGAIFEWNPAAERLFGYRRDEVLGRSLPELIIPERLLPAHVAGLVEFLTSGGGSLVGKRTEWPVRRRDGSEVSAEISLTRIGTREPAAFVGFIRDISDRKSAERALLERSQAAQVAADVAMILTTDGALPDLLRRCAEAMVAHLGVALVRIWARGQDERKLELQVCCGQASSTSTLDSARPSPYASLDLAVVADTEAVHFVDDPSRDDRGGEAEWLRAQGLSAFAGHPLLFQGELVGVMALYARAPFSETTRRTLESIAGVLAVRIHAKLTERENADLEAQLRQAQRMDAVGRLAGGVAHDFNNLLSVVMVSSEALLDLLTLGDPLRADVEAIHLAGARAADLTRQLLTFSRQQVTAPRVIDLNASLMQMERMLRRVLGEDVELTCYPTARDARVRVDSGSIEQVIVNLAINARDAMPAGGRLTMSTETVFHDDEYVRVHLGASSGRHVVLSMKDSGTGMDAATMARIFEPFFTTKETGKGTGLGLSTVFGIVQRSGGHLTVESAPHSGSTFVVHLPLVDAPLEPAEAATEPATLRGTETVLLVEDEELVRQAAVTILRRHGYQVLDAASPAEAERLFATHGAAIDLLVSDVVMPKTNGPALARRFRASHPTLRVLCMSGYTDDPALESAACHFLQKPFTTETLLLKVREALTDP
jgi:two-component system cell cycle sensor histidine kinase/response regulator CckA